MKLEQIKKIYFIGIGGIGMSALARYFKSIGVEVVGSDRDLNSDSVKSLQAEGFEIYDQTKIDSYNVLKLMFSADCVVYTVAVSMESLEIKTAQTHNKPLFTYAEMLGQISAEKITIAVAGTHGKTTTTAMTAEIAKNLNLEPNVIVGSFLNWQNEKGEEIKTNFVAGQSDLFIVEACEYKRSFLNLNPNILIITNLEADHLDYYKDLADVQQAFYDLAAKIPADGKIICNAEDPNLEKIAADFRDKIIDYPKIISKVPEMLVFGKHNQANAAAAISAIQAYLYLQKSDIEIESEQIFEAVKSFRGTWRRMEFKGITEAGATIYDDYGHHPTEIKVTLEAFRQNFPNKKIAVVFQAHLHSRTKMFFDDFVRVLATVDSAIIYPIYRARAEDDYGVSAELLVEKINEKIAGDSNENSIEPSRAEFSDSFEKIAEEIEKLDDKWLVILLGAGEVYQIADKLNFS